ncbi:hypothetical protein ACHAWF_005367, partial [Thalassiosira exigua]
MQNALSKKSGSRVALDKGVHHALDDFRWLHENISTRPTRIAELIPLAPSAEGHHDASGAGAGGVWFPGPLLVPRRGFQAGQPLLWRLRWPEYITKRLVTDSNPHGTLTNSDLELAGGLLHLDAITQAFDTFLHVGTDDPRLNTAGKIDFRIARMIAAWKKEDPPPMRVKPVPIQVLRRLAYLAQHSHPTNHLLRATVDMIIIAFFFLLRPGEYTDSSSDTTPFTLEDVQLFVGTTRLNLWTAPECQLLLARFGSLTFTEQKNGVRGEVIGLGCSGDPYLCPVKAHIAFFFLLRPGEYTDSSSDSTPFTLDDVQLFVGTTRLNLWTAPECQLLLARFGSLTFTEQKNGVRGEVIGLGCSGDPYLCPVKALVRRILYLRSENASPHTPLARVFNSATSVTPSQITSLLRQSVCDLGTDLGFLPSDVSAR